MSVYKPLCIKLQTDSSIGFVVTVI